MHKIIPFQTIDSTNSYLKENFKSLEEGDVCFSLHQTGGRGRLGRKWQDEGKDLLFSVLFKENINEKTALALPLIMGAVMQKTLKSLGVSSSIKWPNDIMIGDRKASGILVEGVSSDHIEALIAGMGLNLNEEIFPDDISHKATSLYIETKKQWDPQEVLEVFLNIFDTYYRDYLEGGEAYLECIKENFYLKGKKCYLNYHNENLSGIVMGIDQEGALLLDDGAIIHHLKAGEVTLESSYQNRKLVD